MIRLQGGTKSLKKLFIDRKIPAAERCRIPVVCDDEGVLGVYGIGANIDRLASGDGAVEISFIRNIAEK
jgi:tRNA(Ile)-lysidine synthase